MPESEERQSPEELLEELRHITGWSWRHPGLDALAVRALGAGCLESAYDVASLQFAAAWSQSSNSSGLAVVFGPEGRVEDSDAFLLLLRQQLIAALADRSNAI